MINWFADYVDILEGNEDNLKDMVQSLSIEARHYGLSINSEKTKTIVFGHTFDDDDNTNSQSYQTIVLQYKVLPKISLKPVILNGFHLI